MRKPDLAQFQFHSPKISPSAHLERRGRIPQLLVKLHQRLLYARLCHQSADPFSLRGLEHKVLYQEQSPEKGRIKKKLRHEMGG